MLAQGFFSANLLDINAIFNPKYYALLLAQPVLYFIFLYSLLGFIFSNMAMYKSQVSIIYPIIYPLSELMILVGSVVIFGDDISITTNFWRVIGIICIFFGFIILVIKNYRNLASFMLAGSISDPAK